MRNTAQRRRLGAVPSASAPAAAPSASSSDADDALQRRISSLKRVAEHWRNDLDAKEARMRLRASSAASPWRAGRTPTRDFCAHSALAGWQRSASPHTLRPGGMATQRQPTHTPPWRDGNAAPAHTHSALAGWQRSASPHTLRPGGMATQRQPTRAPTHSAVAGYQRSASPHARPCHHECLLADPPLTRRRVAERAAALAWTPQTMYRWSSTRRAHAATLC
jgi:hypothetical protein